MALSCGDRTGEAPPGVQTRLLFLLLPTAGHLPLLFRLPGCCPCSALSLALHCNYVTTLGSPPESFLPLIPRAFSPPDNVTLILVGCYFVCLCPSLCAPCAVSLWTVIICLSQRCVLMDGNYLSPGSLWAQTEVESLLPPTHQP